MNCTCQQCNRVFQITDGKPHKFCSGQCYHRSRVGIARPDLWRPETKECPVCAKSFVAGGPTNRNSKRTIFCSLDCARKARFRSSATARILTETEVAYLAGVVDGEGSIILQRQRGRALLRLVVTNTNMALLDWCFRVTAVGNANWTHGPTERHKRRGHWLVNSGAAESVIVQIAPYLIVKREQAELGLDFMRRLRIPSENADRVWQEEYRLRMAALNKRGPTP